MMTGSNVSPKKRSLEDLFRPPLDIMFHGTFQNVRYILWLITPFCNLEVAVFLAVYKMHMCKITRCIATVLLKTAWFLSFWTSLTAVQKSLYSCSVSVPPWYLAIVTEYLHYVIMFKMMSSQSFLQRTKQMIVWHDKVHTVGRLWYLSPNGSLTPVGCDIVTE
jgi:hypothetical protein